MIPRETVAAIRRLFYAEHWRLGTIAAELGLPWETVRRAVYIVVPTVQSRVRRVLAEPYVELVRDTLEKHPSLRATRIYDMLRSRGYVGSVVQIRRLVARMRPPRREAFARLRMLPGEQAQVDWAHFGTLRVGRAVRRISGFVLVLAWSRAVFLEFFHDQQLESFLRGHVDAFCDLGGVPRVILYDNLRSAVVARQREVIQFHPRLLDLASHYHFDPRPCHPYRANEKGRVERAIQYVRHSFFAARRFRCLEDLNHQARQWRDEIALARRWAQDDSRTVADALAEERSVLLRLPLHALETDVVRPVRSGKTPFVRFDLNDYSIPPEAAGKMLTLAASTQAVRLLDGATEIARHERSWDRHALVEDPAHRDALLATRRGAEHSGAGHRLATVVPESENFLAQALERGEPLAATTRRLLLLLDDYGAAALRTALGVALERGTPRAGSVAFLLEKQARERTRPPLPVTLEGRPDLANLVIPHNDMEAYDDLTRNDHENDHD